MPPTDSSGPVVLISWNDLSHLKPIELKSDHNRVLVRSLMNNFHFLHILLVVCVLEPGEHHHEKWYVFKEIIHNYSLLPLWKKQVSWNYWVKWINLVKKEGTCKNPSLYPRAQWHFGQKVLQGKKKVFMARFNEKTWQVKKRQAFHNYQNQSQQQVVFAVMKIAMLSL